MTPYLLLIAARSRQPLAPAVATLFVLLGVFAYRPNDVGSTWGLTGLLAMALACWATAAVPRGEPDEQADVATVALGGTGGRRRLQVALVAAVAAALTALFTAYPSSSTSSTDRCERATSPRPSWCTAPCPPAS